MLQTQIKHNTKFLRNSVSPLQTRHLEIAGYFLFRLVFRGAESYAYLFIHENFCLIDLQWNQPLTWYLAAIGVDFCYYWVHRACHGKCLIIYVLCMYMCMYVCLYACIYITFPFKKIFGLTLPGAFQKHKRTNR